MIHSYQNEHFSDETIRLNIKALAMQGLLLAFESIRCHKIYLEVEKFTLYSK